MENGKFVVEYETLTGRTIQIRHNDSGTGVVIDWNAKAGGSVPAILTGTYSSFKAARGDLERYLRHNFKKDQVAEMKRERSSKQGKIKIAE